MYARFLSVILTLFAGAQAAWALDWTVADALFAEREGNRAAIAEARQAYEDLLAQATSSADKIRAVAQLGRLAIYEGEMLLAKDAKDERRAVFQQCWCAKPKVGILPPFNGSCEAPGFVDAISPANLGEEHPAYHYFRGVCLGYWGEQASLREQLAFTGQIVDHIEKGKTLDTRYEGGGINRLAAGVYSNPKAKAIGLYKPAEALESVDQALRAAPYPGDPSGGADYYDNWHAKASVLSQLHEDDPNAGYGAQAIALVTAKLTEMDERIEDEDLPPGREPEFHYNYRELKRYYQELTGSEWP